MRIKVSVLVFLMCFICLLESKTYYFFQPPEHWELVNPKLLSPSVEIGFFGKGKSKFHPTINLASEDVDISLEEYVKEVKQIHRADRNSSVRDLGQLTTNAGIAKLLALTTKTKFGTVQMLQAIIVKNRKAIVLTGAMQKNEFIDMYPMFIKAFRSLTFVENLVDPISDIQKKEALQLAITNLQTLHDPTKLQKQWNQFQKLITKSYQELGSYWQILILKEVQSKITK